MAKSIHLTYSSWGDWQSFRSNVIRFRIGEELREVKRNNSGSIDFNELEAGQYRLIAEAIDNQGESLPFPSSKDTLNITIAGNECNSGEIATRLPSSNWRIAFQSSAENTASPISNALDQDGNTSWIPGKNLEGQSFPHEFKLDLLESKEVNGHTIKFTDPGKRFKGSFELFVSDDSIDWGIPVWTGSLDLSLSEEERFSFPKTQGRYVRYILHQTEGDSSFLQINDWALLSCGDSPSTRLPRRDSFINLVVIYPNPVKDLINIEAQLKEDIKKLQITILNAVGQQLHTSSVKPNGDFLQTSIPTTNWADGIYILQIETADQQYSARFIKRK